MKIKLLITGGTFDKEYNELNGQLFFRDTHVSEMLSLGRNLVEIEYNKIFMIDSLEMTEAHRLKIKESCQNSSQNHIVITHGTDTMVLTAEYLGGSDLQKTIVLTGAMVPYKFGSSDGLFNLGSAIAFAQTLPPGVYIAMNGRALPYNKVKKNLSTGLFEEVRA